ncbi:DUF1957 domain-containing protein [Leptospira sp. 96542]|nr:DUF1957 domain-containing protein [Leptospira sp. 96542]
MNPKGHLVLVLHAHLPFVRHPNYESSFIEENWLNEAILETYIPLLRTFRNLKRESVPFKITMSFTPTLSSMLVDPYLISQFESYLKNLIQLAKNETIRTKDDPHLNYLAHWYLDHFTNTLSIFNETEGDLTKQFLEFVESGNLEILTSPATHAFLPNYESEPSIIRSQLKNGRRTFRRVWGRDPKGIWLSECGYSPGFEQNLEREGFRYFFVDTHGINHANPRPKFGVYAPVEVGAGVFAFGRDPESSKQVWSSIDGYPGDFRYREYYRDIGHDLPWEIISPYMRSNGVRINTGIKYHRITGKSDAKDFYHPDWAVEACGDHAEDFLRNRIHQVEYLYEQNKQEVVVVSPYDAELFGHWWYEGPKFIEFLCKKIHFDQNTIQLSFPMEAARAIPRIQSVSMQMSSWGENGYGDVWLNRTNDWIYPLIHSLAIRMQKKVLEYKNGSEADIRILKQMGRELLLLESSDWAFIMKTGTMVDYAVKRTNVHANLFLALEEMLGKEEDDHSVLLAAETEHNIFPDIRLEDFI